MTIFPYLEVTGPSGEYFRAEIKGERCTIGRFEQWNDVALFPDPQQLISRKAHCTIEYSHQAWWVIDNGSANRTFLQHQPGSMEIVSGRARLSDGESICVLGLLSEDEQPKYWRLEFHDPARTNPAGYGDLPAHTFLAYHWTEARLYRTVKGEKLEITNLRPQEHKLLRYMAGRNRANDDVPVLCSFEELITAVWGEESKSDTDLAHLVWQLRRKIEVNFKDPQFLQVVRGLGYRLQDFRTIPASSHRSSSAEAF